MTPALFSVTLPWPDRSLSPNVRLPWGARHDAKVEARELGKLLAIAERVDTVGILGPLAARYDLYPPNRRHYDLDNLVAMLKPSQDGVCLALDINDRQIREATYALCDTVPGGQVVLQLTRLIPTEEKP